MKKQKNRGFTIVELLGVFALIGVIAAISLGAIQGSKKKKADLQVKDTLSRVQVGVANYDIAPGVSDFSAAFSAKGVSTTLSSLATTVGVVAGEYEYAATADEFAVVFPLKKTDTFYCVDSTGAAKETSGLLNTVGPRSCSNATRYVAVSGWTTGGGGGGGGGANTPPVLTLSEPIIVGYTVWTDFFTYKSQTVYGVTPATFPEPSYTATDAQDGDLTSSVVIVFPDTYRVHMLPKEGKLLAALKSLVYPQSVEAKGGGGGCLAVTTRMYQVTDKGGLTATAYRDFTSVCS